MSISKTEKRHSYNGVVERRIEDWKKGRLLVAKLRIPSSTYHYNEDPSTHYCNILAEYSTVSHHENIFSVV